MKTFYSIASVAMVAVLGSTAVAGAPEFKATETAVASPVALSMETAQSTQDRGGLSAAEIRNAVMIEADRLSETGVDIDTAAFDGIGLDVAAMTRGDRTLSEAELRNAVTVAADRMIEGGNEIDPATMDGIGYDDRNDIYTNETLASTGDIIDPDWVGSRG